MLRRSAAHTSSLLLVISFSKTRYWTIVLTEEAFFFSQDDWSESGDQQLACFLFIVILTADGGDTFIGLSHGEKHSESLIR